MQPDCIFCRIVAGQLPSCRIYEDESVMAFLDIAPLIKGHTLVIPKQHVDLFMDAPADIMKPLFHAVQRVARAMLHGLKADGVNIHQANGKAAGQVVPHLHVHVVPRFLNDGHAWNWHPKKYDDQTESLEMATRIKNALK